MFYSIKEGFAGLFRAKFSTFVTISIISLSLVIIGLFLIFIVNTKRVVDSIHNRIELEVFIDNSYDSLKIEQLRNRIQALRGVKAIKYTSREEAAEIFKRQFDQDVFQILDENPLPASFQIKLSEDFRSSAKAEQLVLKLENIEGVDEVIFRQDILIILEKYIRIAIIIISIIGGLLGLGSIFLVSNTIKLTIFARIQLIETMKLVGAAKGFIRRPFIVEGLIQGILGAVIAVFFLYSVLKIINIEITDLIIINNEIFLIILALGLFLGFSGSIFAIQRFLKY